MCGDARQRMVVLVKRLLGVGECGEHGNFGSGVLRGKSALRNGVIISPPRAFDVCG